MPIFDRLATAFVYLGNVKFARMDAASNEVEGLEVRGYPTLLLYSQQNKTEPIKYAGNKDFEGIKEWIQAYLQGQEGTSSQKEEL